MRKIPPFSSRDRFATPPIRSVLGTKLANSIGMFRSKTNTPCRLRARLRLVLAIAISVLATAGGASPARGVATGVTTSTESWRWLGSVGGGREHSIALAQSAFGDVAVGDLTGVSWWRDNLRERAVLPGVRDLAFDATGLLWIATSDGLYSWSRTGRPFRKRLGGGEAGNRIARVAVSHFTLLLATDAGAVWSSDGKIFQRLGASAAAAPISHVALRPARFDRSTGVAPLESRNEFGSGVSTSSAATAGVAQAWIYGAGRLSVIRGLESSSGMRVTSSETVSIALPSAGLGIREPGAPGDQRSVVDLVIDPGGHHLHLVFEDSIAWRSIDRRADSSSQSASGWRFERPNLPPGASIRALGWAAGRVWIATDHGLLAGDTIRGPFRRAASPVGTTNCAEIQAGDFPTASALDAMPTSTRALALCRTGLFALFTSSAGVTVDVDVTPIPFRSPTDLALVELPPDPPLAEIRRRAFLRAGLTVGRSHDLWDRLRRRAYWPELELRFDLDFDYDDERDFDQAFLSGDTRFLRDRTRDEGHSYHAGIALDWDLGEAVFPLESVDLSRELRQVVTLRDDVADEINQLYFERQAIRESLGAARPIELAEAARLRWRARELDAGLDAWTGGWISQWRSLQRIGSTPDRASRPDWSHQPETHHPK